MCNNVSINILSNEWSIDAFSEKEINYFYEDRKFSSVLRGDYFLVLGRKGSGKSALFNKILSMQSENLFAESVTLTNMVPNETDSDLRNPYAFWKYIIYVKIFKMLIRNQKVLIKNRQQLEELFPEVQEFDTELYNWKLDSFLINIMDLLSFQFNRENKRRMKIEKKAELIEQITLNIFMSIKSDDENRRDNKIRRDDKSYYIVFDQLDIAYQTVQNLLARDPYHEMILGLLRAANDIKKTAQKYELRIFPIIFMRDDIFNNLYFSDKSKFKEKSIRIVWDNESLKNLLSYRISCSSNQMGQDFKVAMRRIFDNNLIQEEVFKTILQMSHYRPRDIINYMKKCCDLAKDSNSDKVTFEIMKEAEIEYVNSLVGDLVDELFPIIPKFEQLKSLIGQLNTDFYFNEFKELFDHYQESFDFFLGRNAMEIINVLFDSCIIGIIDYTNMVPIDRYKYMGDNIHIDTRLPFTVHPVLRKYFYNFNYFYTESRHPYMCRYKPYF